MRMVYKYPNFLTVIDHHNHPKISISLSLETLNILLHGRAKVQMKL